MQRLINLSDKPFRFQADGKEWVVPPKQDAKTGEYFYIFEEQYDAGVTQEIAQGVRVPVLHPVTKEPVTRKAFRSVVRSSKKPIAGAKAANFVMINETVVRELKLGDGPKWMNRSGIKPSEIVFGQEAQDHLDREIAARQAEIARLEQEAELKKASVLGGLEERRAALEEEIARAEARLKDAQTKAIEAAAPAVAPAPKPPR